MRCSNLAGSGTTTCPPKSPPTIGRHTAQTLFTWFDLSVW